LIVRLTDAAEGDLAGIWAYIATHASEATATRFVSSLETQLDKIGRQPRSGAPREHLAPGLRAAFHRTYVIYYRIEARRVLVLRVIHGARDIAAIAGRGELR
jgi:toxin ParE1/3/4